MNSKDYEVLAFLAELKSLMGHGKFYMLEDRQKNQDTLTQLHLIESQRISCISNLNKEDYCEGPLTDHYGNEAVWVFGLTIKSQEVYIKLTISKRNGKKAICISFHLAEHSLSYPFK